jgi:hypothetical protein
MDWRLYADPVMAPLRRSSGGAISRSWFGSYGAIRDNVQQVVNFQTFNTEEKPFPFSDWPS